MPHESHVVVAPDGEPPRQVPRIEPAMPRPPWVGTSTVRDVLYAQNVNGLSLSSTIGELHAALQISNSVQYPCLLRFHSNVEIGDMPTRISTGGMDIFTDALDGYFTYDKLRDYAMGAALLRIHGVETLLQWSDWEGSREDITPYTRDALDAAVQAVGLQARRLVNRVDTRAVLLGSYGEAIVQSEVAMSVLKLVYQSLCSLSEPPFWHRVQFKACPAGAAASGSSNPDLLLVPSDNFGFHKRYHLLCCEVKTVQDPHGDQALAQAMSCGSLLTPSTGYSVIAVGVRGTGVQMGLMTTLQTPPIGAQSTDEEVDFQGVHAPLPPLPQSLFRNSGLMTLRREGLTWGVEFDYVHVIKNNPVVLRKYLGILCKPVAYGMQRSQNIENVPLRGDKEDKPCRILQLRNVPRELRPMNGSSGNVIVKRMTVRVPNDVIEIHRLLGCPIRMKHICELSRKMEDVPTEQQVTEVMEATSRRSEEQIQVDKYKGYMQLCCVYNYVQGTTAEEHRLNEIGQAVLLCMVAAMHDELHVAHCKITASNMLLKPGPTAGHCTLQLIGLTYGVRLRPDEEPTPKLPMHEDSAVVWTMTDDLGRALIRMLKKARRNFDDQYDDKKKGFYRFLDFYRVVLLVNITMDAADFKTLVNLLKDQDKPSRDAVRWLVKHMASHYLLKRVAELIEQHQLVDMTYAQLAAFQIPT